MNRLAVVSLLLIGACRTDLDFGQPAASANGLNAGTDVVTIPLTCDALVYEHTADVLRPSVANRIVVGASQVVTLALAENRTTGYQWSVVASELPEPSLDDYEIQSETAGIHRLQWNTAGLAIADYALTLALRRSPSEVTQSLLLTVRVQEGCATASTVTTVPPADDSLVVRGTFQKAGGPCPPGQYCESKVELQNNGTLVVQCMGEAPSAAHSSTLVGTDLTDGLQLFAESQLLAFLDGAGTTCPAPTDFFESIATTTADGAEHKRSVTNCSSPEIAAVRAWAAAQSAVACGA